MAKPTTTDEALDQAAFGPKSMAVGDTSVTQQSVDEIIKADRYKATKAAASAKGMGFRTSVGTPPGCGG